tara:strand:- start:934 stop:1653 length:720 start_codon:yes stop_codon:yes gene_type:complete
MSTALLFFNEKRILIKDKSSGVNLIEPFRIDSFNKFVEDRLKHLIQTNVIQKGIDIEEVLVDASECILVPNEIYNPSKKEAYLKLNYVNIDAEKVIVDEKLESINAYFISTRLRWFINFCENNLPQIPIANTSRKYLDRILKENKTDIHIVLKENTFDLIKLQSQKLYSFNTIEYNTVTDVIYFLIAHLNKLPIKAKSIVLYGSEKQGEEAALLFAKVEALSTLRLNTFSENEFINLLS